MVESKITFKVKGMTCVNCGKIVEKSIKSVGNIKYVSVNVTTGDVFVIADEIDFDKIKNAIKKVGYDVVSHEEEEENMTTILKQEKGRLIFSWIFLVVMIAVAQFFHEFRYFNLILSGLVIFLLGYPILKSAYIALKHLHANMDTLISVGAIVSWFTGVLRNFGIVSTSFEMIGAMMITIHITGRYIEQRLKNSAVINLKRLMKLKSKEARIISEGYELIVPIKMVKRGDVVVVKPGELIPVDGKIVEGESLVDESPITGEPIPVMKGKGDSVISGSISINGSLKIEVEKSGNDSFISQVIELVKTVQGAKNPIQAIADKITNFFVPMVFLISIGGAIFWYFNYENLFGFIQNIRNVFNWIPSDKLSFIVHVVISTIVISCPCALGIATPIALLIGSSVSALKGLLIKNGAVFQIVKDIDAVLFDKTGTLTEGRPTVMYHNLDTDTADAVASIESLSSHPLSKAISSIGKSNLKVKNFRELHGKGVTGEVNGNVYFIGRPIDATKYENFFEKGFIVVEVLRNTEPAGFIVITDPIRPDSKEAIERLKDMNLDVVMVTGDNKLTAKYVAEHLNISMYYAQVDPKEKYEIVKEYQMEGKKVIFAGDGINDAGALKGADIGIAVEQGVDIAVESADVVIVKGGISKVVEFISISKRVYKVIVQNLFWAFFYNAVAVPVALSGILNPVIAEIAMILSSITVILNSMKLRRFKGV